MKILSVKLHNFLGFPSANLTMDEQPITMVVAANGGGKSTLGQAIRFAFLNEYGRVDHKKDLPAMVTEGEKKGFVSIVHDGGSIDITMPKGDVKSPEGVPTHMAIPYVLNPAHFASVKDDERRKLLTAIGKVKSAKQAIIAGVAERKLDDAKIKIIMPMLAGGFSVAEDWARGQVAEMRTAWQSVTGTKWGSIIAESWAAESVTFDEEKHKAAAASVVEFANQVESMIADLAKYEQIARTALAGAGKEEERLKKVANLPRFLKKLEVDQAALAEWTAKVEACRNRAGSGDRTGQLHELAAALHGMVNIKGMSDVTGDLPPLTRARKVLADYVSIYGEPGAAGDPEAIRQLPELEKALGVYQRSVDNDKRDIADAEAAKKAGPGVLEQAPTDEFLTDRRNALAKCKTNLAAARTTLQTLNDQKAAASTATQRTADAKQHHTDLLQWEAIREAFSPSGIPGKLLQELMEPINAFLLEASDSAQWRIVQLDGDMNITATTRDPNGGPLAGAVARPYRMHSEGEQYRINTILALMIAHFSGLKLIMLDRFDVLDATGRADLFACIEDAVEWGWIEQALLLGTLKAKPSETDIPRDKYGVHWINKDKELV